MLSPQVTCCVIFFSIFQKAFYHFSSGFSWPNFCYYFFFLFELVACLCYLSWSQTFDPKWFPPASGSWIAGIIDLTPLCLTWSLLLIKADCPVLGVREREVRKNTSLCSLELTCAATGTTWTSAQAITVFCCLAPVQKRCFIQNPSPGLE